MRSKTSFATSMFPKWFVKINVGLFAIYVLLLVGENYIPVATWDWQRGQPTFIVLWMSLFISLPALAHHFGVRATGKSPFKEHAGAIGLYLFLAFLFALKSGPLVASVFASPVRTYRAEIQTRYGQPQIQEEEWSKRLVLPAYSAELVDGNHVGICANIVHPRGPATENLTITHGKILGGFVLRTSSL